MEQPMDRFAECFEDLPDPRAGNALHDLTEILFIALMATLCGATSCTDMALFARMKAYLWRDVLVLKNGLPSHDTFSRVFRMLDPEAFEKAFQRFMKAFAKGAKIKPPKGVIALDGKALRRGYESGRSHMPPVMVTAWAAQTRMALANVQAPNNNEAAGALQLIELLQLKGCVVTADALHCHRGMAEAIKARGGDYVLAVKDNQPALMRDAKAAIRAATRQGKPSTITVDAGHGRKEKRRAVVAAVPQMAQDHDFAGLKAVARITSKRGTDKTVERYFLMSQAYPPKDVLRIVRTHWTIENSLHWPLDVVLDEDLARNRKDNAPANLAVLRRLALNVARAHPDNTTSLRGKLKRAGWNDTFLFELIQHMR
ncbi:ISAs1-like element ISRpa5 family transposase [Rhodopseudomonas palustris]|uniref:Transposase, IS4 family n=1 Tax=Rhodopseudomonas palustris (strain BisB18) TaxID=316056 RepID=Q216R2_RHOPB